MRQLKRKTFQSHLKLFNVHTSKLSLISMRKLTRVDDSIDENVARYQTVVVFVHFAEQVREAGFLVVHELQELLEVKKGMKID